MRSPKDQEALEPQTCIDPQFTDYGARLLAKLQPDPT